ncbi:MFS transporter [Plantactinospora sp. GCM10030261]|uniref:MFS transporter n=1 Tax=Plantactinospora sp. GCM10030261 TaxID=3273420 RepID=UPI003610B7D2
MSISPSIQRSRPEADPRRWPALAVVLLAVFMDLVDITIVVVSAPTIQADLGASLAQIQWVMAAYSLALGLLLITGGRLGDIVGRKRVFLAGVALFTLASAACGLAPTVEILIVARTVQGAAAAMMVPQVLSTIQVGFPPAERPKAFGLYGAVNGIAAAAAPIVGGLLVGNNVFGLEWRSIFWINVPIGLVALLGAATLLRESRSEHRSRLDVAGVFLVTVALLALLLPLIQGEEWGWPWWGWAAMVGAGVVLVAFGRHQARRERGGSALVPVSLFRQRSFLAGLLAALVMFSSIAAFFLVLTVQLQGGHGFSPLRTGLTFLAWPVGLGVTANIAVRGAERAGRTLITVGAVLLAVAMLVVMATIRFTGPDLTTWHLVPGLLLGGAGFGLVAPILVDMVLAAVPVDAAGAASGVVNTTIQVSTAAGIAIIGALFAAALGDGGQFDHAAQRALWYPVAAFTVGALLSRALPARARPEAGTHA